MKYVCAVMFVLMMVGCGKNAAVSDQRTPIEQAPQPQPNPPSNPNQQPNSSPTGNPLNPNGYPKGPMDSSSRFRFDPRGMNLPDARYYPWAPFHQYMNSNPYLASYYQNMWNQWLFYARQRGSSPYNFPIFWADFCRYRWSWGNNQYIYNDMRNFYSWVNSDVYLLPAQDVYYFWEYYDGFSF